MGTPGLPALKPETPWYGYSLGDWTEEWDRNAVQATRGEWMQRDASYRQRRRGGVAPNSPVRGFEDPRDANERTPQRIIVGITGASGVIYGIRVLELLADTGVETHLVISKAAELTMTYETDVKAGELRARHRTGMRLATSARPSRRVRSGPWGC